MWAMVGVSVDDMPLVVVDTPKAEVEGARVDMPVLAEMAERATRVPVLLEAVAEEHLEIIPPDLLYIKAVKGAEVWDYSDKARTAQLRAKEVVAVIMAVQVVQLTAKQELLEAARPVVLVVQVPPKAPVAGVADHTAVVEVAVDVTPTVAAAVATVAVALFVLFGLVLQEHSRPQMSTHHN
jgi:hypothetical protein